MDRQTATPIDSAATATRSRTHLPRGSTLRDLEAAGVTIVPVWHETKACAADVLGIGRSLAYELARAGQLPVLDLGHRKVCSVPRLRALVDGAS